MGEYGERAKKYFEEGYNCSQAVFLAFADEEGISLDMAAALASSFGGGFGRMREVCGAVSGMGLVMGLKYGHYSPKDSKEKSGHYVKVQEVANAFKNQNGSIICRELLSGTGVPTDTKPESPVRDKAFYQKRPCKELVGDAADFVAEYLKNHPNS